MKILTNLILAILCLPPFLLGMLFLGVAISLLFLAKWLAKLIGRAMDALH